MVTNSLNRIPVPVAPLPCFALEHDALDPKCKTCLHQRDCTLAMGSREHKTPLENVKFDLHSEAISDNPDPDREDITKLYNSCYAQVFKDSKGVPTTPTRINPEQTKRLACCVPPNGVPLRLFILTAMTVFHQGNPDRKFYPKHLLGPSAQTNVELYRKASALRYGVFDLTTLTSLSPATENSTQALVDSEWLAANWVVNYRVTRGKGAVTSLYSMQELSLDPRWLSTEPTYARWLKATDTPASDDMKRHRHLVTQAAQGDWRHERERLLPETVMRILAHNCHGAGDFEAVSPVRYAMSFWASLGDAILQVKLLNFINHA